MGGVGEEVYRLSLERGSFLAPLKTGASSVNALAVGVDGLAPRVAPVAALASKVRLPVAPRRIVAPIVLRVGVDVKRHRAATARLELIVVVDLEV